MTGPAGSRDDRGGNDVVVTDPRGIEQRRADELAQARQRAEDALLRVHAVVARVDRFAEQSRAAEDMMRGRS